MLRGQESFIREAQVFADLFSRSKTYEFDFDVLPNFESVELGEVTSKVDDPHGISHVEYERVTRPSHHRSLKNKLHGLRNRHEIAGHSRIRDRNRSPAGELLPKQWYDAAATTENIAESHG